MRVNKKVALKGAALFAPIELPDLVVGMNHLGWSALSHHRFEAHRRTPRTVLLGIVDAFRVNPFRGTTGKRGEARPHRPSHWIEATIEQNGDRTLVLRGRASLRERGSIDALAEALARGARWLSPEGPG